MKKATVILALFFILQQFSYSQELYTPLTNTQGWINFGAGGCFINYDYGFSGLIGVTYAHKGKLVSSRFTYSETMAIDFSENPTDKDKEVKEFSIMYGFLSKRKFAFMSMAIGLGYMNLKEKYLTRSETIREIGISFETQVFMTLPVLGVGVCSFANINRKVFYPGILMAVQLGKLR